MSRETYDTNVSKIGGSHFIRIPIELFKKMEMEDGEPIRLTVEEIEGQYEVIL